MTTPELAAELATELTLRRERALKAKTSREPSKPRRIYASGLSECDRQMVYAFTHFRHKEPMSVNGQASVDDGIIEEEVLVAECGALGLPILERGRPFDDDRLWMTGKIDGVIAWQGQRVPVEFKRIKPFIFDKINSVEDLKADIFLLKYLKQFSAYLYLTNNEAGLFGFSDGLGRRKWIVVPLDFAFVETEVVQRAERVKITVDRIEEARRSDPTVDIESWLPPRIPYEKTCDFCPFKTTCLPQVSYGEGAHMAEPEIEAKLTRYLELKPLSAEQERLKKELTPVFEGKAITVAGPYVVTGKKVTVTPKPQTEPPKPYSYWKWDVEALKESA